MTHKPLKTEFRKDQFNFTQVSKDGDVAIYEKTKPSFTKSIYEVILIIRHNGYVIGGSNVEPSECYPSSESFGRNGWTYPTLEMAQAKAQSLVSKRRKQ